VFLQSGYKFGALDEFRGTNLKRKHKIVQLQELDYVKRRVRPKDITNLSAMQEPKQKP
jgi:hypothetical protein